MKVKLYQAIWKDENGAFTVNGSVSRDKEECVSLCRKHVSVKNGAKLIRIDEWEEWIED